MSSLWQTVSENVVFVLEFLALIVVMFLIAYVIEKAVKKKNSDTERVLATRKIVVIGVFSAIAAILMVLEFPVPFAPSFYGLDFSELPALIGAFAYGPVAGVSSAHEAKGESPVVARHLKRQFRAFAHLDLSH